MLEQKLIELPEDVSSALKNRADQEYKTSGQRVTETQIIIDALRKHLALPTPWPLGEGEDFLTDKEAERRILEEMMRKGSGMRKNRPG